MDVTEPTFAHPVEAEFARLLDECGLDWEYEPHVFVLERDVCGRPLRAFTPDFYLPALDVYVECTVMKPAYLTRKRWKAREAARRYGIVIAIRERADLARLAERYGLRLGECAVPSRRRAPSRGRRRGSRGGAGRSR